MITNLIYHFVTGLCSPVYDSSSQGKSGLLSGLKADFGHFDQCIRSTSLLDGQLEQPMQPSNGKRTDDERTADRQETGFVGKFCMLSIRTNEHDVLVRENPFLYRKTMGDLTRKNREWYEYNLGSNIAAVCIPSTCAIDRLLDVINSS